ncbi:TPA: SIR2 family protein [Pseudomonas putida]
MEFLSHSASETVQLLADYFKHGTLVPIFGAGFTVGETAESGAKVPSGKTFSQIMREQLKEHGIGLSEEDHLSLADYKFSDLCDVYFDDNVLSQTLTKQTIQKFFYNVTLSSEKTSLINDINWKYIYTLNIDNAIEKHSQYNPIYPYDSNLRNESRSYRPIYKLHGDVYYEVTHSADRLVFRKASYLESIQTNKRMLELLAEDLTHKNILFIGCSLTDEDDIAFLVSGQKQAHREITKRIIFASERPGPLQLSVLRRHGINTVIMIDPGQYGQIYSLIQSAYQLSAETDNELERYRFTPTVLDDDPDKNREFLISGVSAFGGAPTNSSPIIPYYYGKRTKEPELIEKIKLNGTIAIFGPRVSGRTLMLRSVADKFKDRRVFFVESGTELEGHFINRLLGLSNSLIIFDSKTINHDLAKIIKTHNGGIKERNTSVLVVLDVGEGFLIDALSPSRLSHIPVVDISRVFDTAEIKFANVGLRGSRCPAFTKGKKLLDNIFLAYEALGQNTIIKRTPKEKDLLKLLYLLSVRRKVDGDWGRYISQFFEKLEDLVAICSPYLEFEQIAPSEVASHSGYKLVCHSEAWLLAVIAELYKSRGESWCVEAIFGLVQDLPDDEKRLAIDLSLFDNLNFAFGGDYGGAGDLILKFYERLENLRGAEAEFYVQKAKAYYSMYRRADVVEKLSERLDELRLAHTWARAEHNPTAERNIIHTSALISLRRASECNFSDTEYTIEAIQKTWQAISSESSNFEYVEKLADGNLKASEYLTGLLKAIDSGDRIDAKYLEVKDLIDSIRVRMPNHSQRNNRRDDRKNQAH